MATWPHLAHPEPIVAGLVPEHECVGWVPVHQGLRGELVHVICELAVHVDPSAARLVVRRYDVLQRSLQVLVCVRSLECRRPVDADVRIHVAIPKVVVVQGLPQGEVSFRGPL